MDPRDDYERLFAEIPMPVPPEGLADRILYAIARRERRMLAVKAVVASVLFVGSVWVAVMGYRDLMDGLSRSGFFTFASLLFSDFFAVAANLPDFLFSIIESFPVFSAAALLGGIGLAIWSVGMLINDAAKIRTRRFLSPR